MRATATDRTTAGPAQTRSADATAAEAMTQVAMAQAVAALRAGDPTRAAHFARAVLAGDRAKVNVPEGGATSSQAAAHFLLGSLAEQDGRLDEAEAAYARAADGAPRNPGYRMALGNLAFARSDAGTAEACYRQALALDPFSAAIHNNLAHALKRLGRLQDALHHYRQSLELGRGSRWFSRSAMPGRRPDPSRAESFTTASRAKLDHDIEQFEHLLSQGLLPPDFATEVEAYRALRDGLPADAPCRPVLLDDGQRAGIAASYNRVIHLPRAACAKGEALNPALDTGAVEQSYRQGRPRLAVVDDLLTPSALARLRDFCLDATIWFDCKADDGYLGAYLHEGFAPAVLLDLAEGLRARLPEIFGDLMLSQMWAFKYRSEGLGTRPHADQAAVNVNFWITPDAAALPGRAGGLRLWDAAAPAHWGFDAYNRDAGAIERHLADSGADHVDLPYRCNRAVIFDSSLFHQSLPFAFRPGYANRRINVTMLFGRRNEG